MASSESLAARIRQRLARRKNVEEKKMFGGVGFPLNGNLLVGVWKDSLCGSARSKPRRRYLSRTSRSSTSRAGR
jgi:TfoX/Sxy family transcriptional regulator of competence genes